LTIEIDVIAITVDGYAVKMELSFQTNPEISTQIDGKSPNG